MSEEYLAVLDTKRFENAEIAMPIRFIAEQCLSWPSSVRDEFYGSNAVVTAR